MSPLLPAAGAPPTQGLGHPGDDATALVNDGRHGARHVVGAHGELGQVELEGAQGVFQAALPASRACGDFHGADGAGAGCA